MAQSMEDYLAPIALSIDGNMKKGIAVIHRSLPQVNRRGQRAGRILPPWARTHSYFVDFIKQK